MLTYGNGRTLSKSYDMDYVIDKVVSSASDGLVLDFKTDLMGNIVSASNTVGATKPTRKYRYDNLYRLTSVDDGNDVLQEDYGYNKTGDRTLKQFVGQTMQVYSYLAGTHRLGAITGASSANRSYDASGNTTSRGDGNSFIYDDRNRLSTIDLGTKQYINTYNGKGARLES